MQVPLDAHFEIKWYAEKESITSLIYIVGTQKNLLNESVLLSTQNKC